jgi:hypothetical protein
MGWWGDGLGELLSRIAPRFGDEGSVIVDGRGAELLGLPLDRAEVAGEDGTARRLADHPAVADAARAGWKCSGIGDWSTFTAPDRPTLHVGITPCLDYRTDARGLYVGFPLWGPLSPVDTIASMVLWHRVTGSAWVGNPGIAGTQILKALAPQRKEGTRKIPPTWKPRTRNALGVALAYGPDGPAKETDLLLRHWHHDQAGQFVHGYDANRAYIAALMVLEVSPLALRHTGRVAFDRRLAGWWKIELPHQSGRLAWALPHMPHPAGYLLGDPVERWVTTPTLALLEQLTDEGVFGGVRILDSWLGAAKDTVTRPFAERLRDAYMMYGAGTKDAVPGADSRDVYRVRLALKLAGRQVPGLWDHAANWIHRPDWWHALVAMDRANRWRLMWREGKTSGRWPVAVDHDTMYYVSDEEDPMAAAPSELARMDRWNRLRLDPSGMTLGAYKPAKTFRNRPELLAGQEVTA